MNNEKTVKVMQVRDAIAKAEEYLHELEVLCEGRLPGRYAALGRTALEEADNWFRNSIETKEGER